MPAGDRFVPIHREDIESWLNEFANRSPYKGWVRVGSTAGIYIVKLSEHVGVRISTTLTRGDEVRGVGKGSTKMYLVQVSTNRLLNRKDRGGILQRTRGWKRNWLKKIEHWRDIYLAQQDFYEGIAEIEDVPAFVAEWKAKVESVPNWSDNRWLAKAHATLSRGRVISQRVRESIERDLSAATHPTGARLTPDQQKFIGRMRAMKELAEQVNDDWTVNFLISLITRAFRGQPFTSRQREILRNKMRQYRAS